MVYRPFFTDHFKRDIEKYPDQKAKVEAVVSRILTSPQHRSHLLKYKYGKDLRGKRSRHLSTNFLIIFILCDECIENGFREKGYNNCSFCTGQPEKRVIFLSFGTYDVTYKK